MTTIVLLGISFALNVWLCGLYRTERKRRMLMCTSVGLPKRSNWWPLYYRVERLARDSKKEN